MTSQYIQAVVTLVSANGLPLSCPSNSKVALEAGWGWLEAAELEAAGLEAATGPDVGRRRARGDELQ